MRWTYTFHAKNPHAKLPLALFVKSQWKGYMDVCLANVIQHFAGLPAVDTSDEAGRTAALPI